MKYNAGLLYGRFSVEYGSGFVNLTGKLCAQSAGRLRDGVLQVILHGAQYQDEAKVSLRKYI